MKRPPKEVIQLGATRIQTLSRYLLSLPERTLRSASALCAGLVQELGHVTLPPGIRRTKLYTVMVETTLRFLIEQVGEVEGLNS